LRRWCQVQGVNNVSSQPLLLYELQLA